MADPKNRANIQWEADQAAVALAGVRPLKHAHNSTGSSAEYTYTIARNECQRVIVVHASGGDLDVRVELNATADANSMPILSSVYFVLEVEVGDEIHVFNTLGSAVDIHFLEIR